jgi:N-alpha-acetyltransferase 40
MKSKDLKALRKKLTQLDKLSLSNDWLRTTLSFDVWEEEKQKKKMEIPIVDNTATAPTISTTLTYVASPNMTSAMFQQCLDLFQDNMSTLYRDSSWGLNMSEKAEEFEDSHARFLLVYDTNKTTKTNDQTSSSFVLAAFVHFRFEYDHEEHSTCGVIYVYELQVSKQYQRKGMGKQLMGLMQAIGQQHQDVISKIVLTVFKNNVNALQFYKQTLGYVVDETDPSQFGQLQEDYEILSLTLGQRKCKN